MKIKACINETEIRIEKTNNSGFLERKTKLTNLARFPKKQRYKTQINKIMNKRGDNATDTTRIQGLLRDYYKHLPTNRITEKQTKP